MGKRTPSVRDGRAAAAMTASEGHGAHRSEPGRPASEEEMDERKAERRARVGVLRLERAIGEKDVGVGVNQAPVSGERLR